MDTKITEAVTLLKDLSQKLAMLITKEMEKQASPLPTMTPPYTGFTDSKLVEKTAAAMPTGEVTRLIIRPSTLTEKAAVAAVQAMPDVTIIKAPETKAVEKVDKATLSPDNQKVLEHLLATCKHQSEFTDACKEQFGWKRSEARKFYHDKFNVETTKKVLVKPHFAEIPVQTVPIMLAPTIDGKMTGVDRLVSLDKEAREIYKAQGQIPAIKFIRDNTGMDLFQSKEWIDMFDGPIRPEPDTLKAAKQEFLRCIEVPPKSMLNAQVQAIRQDGIKKAMDGEKGQAVKQLKIDIAGDNKQMLVQAARRIARDLGKNGPITVDNVTAEMGKTHNVTATKGKRQNWKGSIFTKTEWVFIGNTASTQVTSHGRPVGMWALKSWLTENTVNGKETNISSFVVTRLYRDFKHTHPKVELKQCNFYLGEDRIAAEIRDTIVRGGNKLYEIPVTWIPDSIGAVIVPPSTKLM